MDEAIKYEVLDAYSNPASPLLERIAYNQMPKTNDWKDLQLRNYIGTDLYQWYGRKKDSIWLDPDGVPFRIVKRD